MYEQTFRPTDRGTPAARRALAALAARLRPPEGRLATRWSEAMSASGCVDVNETYALVFAWRRQDPAVARELVLTALAGEQPGGILPRRFLPDGRVADAAAPWPLLGQAARMAYLADRAGGAEFPRTVLPALYRTLGCALDSFDPGARGQPLWASEQEAYLPDLWVEGLKSVDLSAFLLAEIEAVIALSLDANAPEIGPMPEFLEEGRRRIADALEREHWVESAEAFRDRMADGKWVTRETVAGLMPLLWPNLRARYREAMLRHVLEPDNLMTATGLAAWEAWPDDPQPPPVRAMDQILLFVALGVEEFEIGRVRLREAIRQRPAGESDLFENCLVAGVEEAPLPGTEALTWWERNWKRVAGVLAVLGMVCAALLLWVTVGRKSMPASSMEVLAGLAKSRYESGDYDESIRFYRMVLNGSKEVSPSLHAFYANAVFRKGDFAEAEAHYRIALKGPDGDHPVLLFNLAQTLIREGKEEEARGLLTHILSEYRDYPRVIQSADAALSFMDDRVKKESGTRQGGQGGEPMR